MLEDGLYDLRYQNGATEPATGYGVASLREGRILGSDRWGGVFSGSYCYDAGRKISEVHVRLTAPPDGVLITGRASGARGTEFDLVAEFRAEGARSSAIVDIEGSPVAVEFSYIGPLPRF